MNDNCFSLIPQHQKYAYGYKYVVKMEENSTLTDDINVAEGFDRQAECVTKQREIRLAFKRSLNTGQLYVLDIIIKEEKNCRWVASINAMTQFE